MNAIKVYLLKRPRTLPSGKRAHYWTLRWSDTNGRQRHESLGRVGKTTRAEATAAQRQKALELGTGSVPRDRLRTMTLSQFIDFHEQTFGHGKRATTLIEWRIAGKHAIAALGDVRLEQIAWSDAGEIRTYLRERNRGASKATVRKTLVALKAMLNRAVKKKLLTANPFADEELGKPISKAKRIFSEPELDAMIEVADLWWNAAIMLAHTSGLRRAELLHLRWSGFDAKVGTVRIEEHHQSRYVAAGRDVPILAWQPKTKRSTRTVPIPASTVAALLRLKMQADGSPYIFLGVKRLLAIDGKAKAGKLRPTFDLICNFTRQFDDIQDAAQAKLGVDNWPHGCFHDLRKTFATRAAGSGVPMHELQAHLGHSSITTTADYYTDVEPSAADRLRKVFARVA